MKRHLDSMFYAMKTIELENLSVKEQEDCVTETKVLAALNCCFIIKYFDAFLSPNQVCNHHHSGTEFKGQLHAWGIVLHEKA